jgi:hypothetical protein
VTRRRPIPPIVRPQQTALGRGARSVAGLAGIALLWAGSSLPAADWPWWRGPDRDGKAAGPPPPLTWSEGEHIDWKTPVPGRGFSSPVVVGGRVLVTSADEERQRQFVLCLDRTAGRPLWSRVVHEGGFMRRHPENSHASATPACDGHRLFCVFPNRGALHVTALEIDGSVAWSQAAGPFDLAPDHEGYGSSPVLHGELVIINGDNRRAGFLAAFDRQTGRLQWRTERLSLGSFGTPVVATLAGRAQLLLSGTHSVDGYDPGTGRLLWTCRGTAEATANTVAFSDRLVFASGGAPEKEMLCVRADGSGDVSDSHVLWRSSRGVAYVPSLLHSSNRLYVVTDSGTARCLEAESGRVVWEERLAGAFKASPVLWGDRLYVGNESGQTFVLRAADRFELRATNALAEGAFATPAIAEGRIFLRTMHHLYCLGPGPAAAR